MKRTAAFICACTVLYAIHSEDSTTSNDQREETFYGTHGACLVEAVICSRDTMHFWNFEDGLQGWTHTNGGTFPAAWDVVSSGYAVSSYIIAPPDAGDSSVCIDGDMGGVCHDTVISPAVNNPGFAWFKWGMHFQNYVNYQTYTVIMRTFSSGSWNPWTNVWTYTVDTPPRYDSVDVSVTVSDSVQVGFVYDQPNATSAWFAAFDNVGLYSLEQQQAGCAMVVSPPAGQLPPGLYDVIGWFINLGPNVETFYTTANVYDTIGMANIFTQTINLTLTAGADTHLYFGQLTFGPDGHFFTEIYPMLPPDINPVDTASSGYSWTTFLGNAEKKTSTQSRYRATTIFTEHLQLPQGTKYRVFDITGRVVEPDKIRPGIYFIEVDGVVTQKVVKVK